MDICARERKSTSILPLRLLLGCHPQGQTTGALLLMHVLWLWWSFQNANTIQSGQKQCSDGCGGKHCLYGWMDGWMDGWMGWVLGENVSLVCMGGGRLPIHTPGFVSVCLCVCVCVCVCILWLVAAWFMPLWCVCVSPPEHRESPTPARR
jgi:hypothetical protein